MICSRGFLENHNWLDVVQPFWRQNGWKVMCFRTVRHSLCREELPEKWSAGCKCFHMNTSRFWTCLEGLMKQTMVSIGRQNTVFENAEWVREIFNFATNITSLWLSHESVNIYTIFKKIHKLFKNIQKNEYLIVHSPSPLDSILEAKFTVSPNKQ